MNLKQIGVRSATEDDWEFAYEVKKRAEGEYITELFDWDEAFQRDFHGKEWKVGKPDIIEYEGKPIGTLSVTKGDDGYNVGRFFIDPDFQRKGIGTHLLKQILAEADAKGHMVRLAFLKNNPVRSLYERLGFELVRREGVLIHMERAPRPKG